MTSLLNSEIVVYLVLFLMLLGAFLIGYFFGNRSDKKKVVIQEVKQVVAQLRKVERKLERIEKRVETTDIVQPGEVRVIKTRERTGQLTEQIETEIIQNDLDLKFLGNGNRSQPDDLQKIIGVDPFIEEKLNKIGINSYDQLSKLRPMDIELVTELIAFFPNRIHQDDWKGQATALLKIKEKKSHNFKF